MAAEVKTMFFGSLRAPKAQSSLKRILAKVKHEHFNGLEVTAIVARHFLGVPLCDCVRAFSPPATQFQSGQC
jgi:hypothetical protein